jgi:voltage-gated potassium channel
VIVLLTRILSAGHRRHIALLLVAVAACMLGGGALFALTQNLPFTTGIYWAILTATTVGYGDVTPHNGVGRVVASAVMLTTIPMLAAAFALVTGGAAAAGVRRVLAMHTRFPEGVYRLVIGMNPTVPAILDELAKVGIPVVLAADIDPAGVRDGVHLVRGDPTQWSTIDTARPAGAEQALITGGSDGDVLVSAVIVRKQAPDLPIVALVTSPSVREALRDLGVRQAVSAQELVAGTLATSLETPHAGDMVRQLVESNRHVLTEIDVGPAMTGKRLSTVRDERAELVLGLVHDGEFTLGVGDDPLVAEGDRLLMAEPADRGQSSTPL